MPISYKNERLNALLYRHALDCAKAARIFTTAQFARHPELSWRARPQKAASEFLARHKGTLLESVPGRHAEPFLWRLTTKAKRTANLHYRDVSAYSLKRDHWLALGDLWLTLTFAGLRPTVYESEPKDGGGFDVYTVVSDNAYMIEVQRSPLTTGQWKQKWARRLAWYKEEGYKRIGGCTSAPPRPVLIALVKQDISTLQAPRGLLVVHSAEAFVKTIKKPPVK